MKKLFSLSIIFTLSFVLFINNFAHAQELLRPQVLQPVQQPPLELLQVPAEQPTENGDCEVNGNSCKNDGVACIIGGQNGFCITVKQGDITGNDVFGCKCFLDCVKETNNICPPGYTCEKTTGKCKK